MPGTHANPVRQTPPAIVGYPNAEGFRIEPAKFRDAAYAVVDMRTPGAPTFQDCADLSAVAVAIHKRRGKRGLQVLDGKLAWGGEADDVRPAIMVSILDGEGAAEDRVMVLTPGANARDLMAELSATRASARKAA